MSTILIHCGMHDAGDRLRAFNVRWQDEDAGWKFVNVLAVSEDAARSGVEAIFGGVPFEVRAIEQRAVH